MQLTITKTDFEILLVRHIFHKKIQEIEGSVNLGRGITPLFPYYTHFPMINRTSKNCILQHCETSAWAPMAKYQYIIGL